MNQLTIFPPASHSVDPRSSFQAEKRITKSGRRETLYNQVLSALKANPGVTGAELAQIMGIDKYSVRRRLSDCKNKNTAIQGESRVCKVDGELAVTWWVL